MTSETEALIAELRAGLDGVTPGPWSVEQLDTRRFLDRPYVVGPSEIVDGYDGICVPDQMNDRQFVEDAANMRHIARCSPDNIRTLLDHIATLEDRVASLEKALDEADAAMQQIADQPERYTSPDGSTSYSIGYAFHIVQCNAKAFLKDRAAARLSSKRAPE